MPVAATSQRLADLLIEPNEDLDIEIKNWLDLANNQPDRATFAKAALALANHGGGYIILGLEEVVAGFTEAAGRPPALDSYSQDLINGIIQNYADPPFHCSVSFVNAPDGVLFPIVSVPGGHRVPVRARRAGPNGQTVENNAIYIRKPGPRSEVPLTSQEWDGLLAKCLTNRRDEMFDQIRALLSGAVPQAGAEPEQDELERWTQQCFERWRGLIAGLPADSDARCPNGFYWIAYEIDGELRPIPPVQFPAVLRRSVVRHTGWPPFWYPTRQGIEPYPIDGLAECWLGGDPQDGGMGDAAHSDFWRISPNGYAFLLRGYQEDGMNDPRSRQPIVPGTVMDVTLPVWRAGEAMLHAASLAANMVEGPATVTFSVHYDGVAGRELQSISGRRWIHDGRRARQNAIDLTTTVEVTSIGPNLPEIMHPLLSPLYSLFDFFELTPALVSEELAKMREPSMTARPLVRLPNPIVIHFSASGLNLRKIGFNHL